MERDDVRSLKQEEQSADQYDRSLKEITERIGTYVRMATTDELRENYARVLALEDKFEMLYDVELATGRYESYVKGQTFSEYANKLFVASDDFFDDSRVNNRKVVYPPDRSLIDRVVTREYITQELSKNNHFDCYYRLIVEGKPTWFRIRGVYKNDRKTNVILGVFNAEEEMAEKLRVEKMRDEQMNRMVFDDGLFIIDCKNDTRKTVHDDCHGARNYSDADAYSSSIEKYVNTYVYERDREMMRRVTNAEYMLKRVDYEEEYTVEYRDISTGVQRFYEMRVARFTDHEVLQGFNEKDKEIIDSLLLQKLKEDYFDLWAVDLDAGIARVIKMTYREGKEDILEEMPYTPMLKKYAEQFEGETREFFEQISSIPYMLQRFASDSKGTYTYQTKIEGETRWVSITSRVLTRREDGKPSLLAIGFSFPDADERHYREMQRQLEMALIHAEDANNAKSRFLFNMSHDIRTPMNAIIGFASLAQKNIGNEAKVREYLEKINLSGHELLELINHVLEMARIESGKIEFEEKPLNIPEKFHSMVTILSEQASDMGINFKYSLEDIKNCNVYADEARMGSITFNIAGNAMKYTPVGGSISFVMREIAPRREGYGTYVLTVEDTGIGMSEEFMKVLYEPFAREKNTTHSKKQGTGLGLSIVKNLVNLLGGAIDVHSEVGKGTRFDVTLDFKLVENGESSADDSPMVNRDSFEGRRILLVEDNEMNREITKSIMEEIGVSVEEAFDGDEAVERLSRLTKKNRYNYYDLILMDIQMPKMNGYDATKAIRTLKPDDAHHIPIIAMTANAFEEDRRDAFAAGMDEHLAKPIDIRLFMDTLAKFLK